MFSTSRDVGQVRQLQRGVTRVGARHGLRRKPDLRLHGAGARHQQHVRPRQVRQRRQPHGGAVGRPAAEHLLEVADDAVGVEVADQHQHRTPRQHRRPVQRPDLLGRHDGDVLGLGHLARGRVVAVAVLLQGLARDRARLRPGDGDPLDQPLLLAGDLVVGVRRSGEDVAEHVEERRQLVGERGSVQHQAFRVDAGADVAADQRQLGVDLDAVAPRGAGQDRLGEHLGDRRVQGVVARERDPQPRLDHRHGRLAHGHHAQAVAQLGVHMGQVGGGPLVAERRQRPRSPRGAADLLGAAVRC
jgi:hypothetical protein